MDVNNFRIKNIRFRPTVCRKPEKPFELSHYVMRFLGVGGIVMKVVRNPISNNTENHYTFVLSILMFNCVD